MAEHYVSEDEQVEAIKKWWKANGSGILVGLVIGVVGVLGWQYWTSYKTEQSELASLHYEALLEAVQASKLDEAREQGTALLSNYSSTTYATLAALMLAKLELEQGDNSKATQHLEWTIENADQDVVRDIAKLRLTRVLLSQGRLDDAEAQLSQVQNLNLTATVEELKGDIYFSRNDLSKARTAYQAAQAAAGVSGSRDLLQLKLDSLPVESAQEG